MKQPEETKPVPAIEPPVHKKPYHAPRLRDYGSLVKLTQDTKGSLGGDLTGKVFL
ncbi:MAG: hypothetical protein FD180_3998 [Planctomycetota bacterium]|nr:MAG: hypothetical protein FD180_3998 [Planctomycetota bacterium]